ncbi:secretory subunit [Malassezia nana]|uniref:Secretory subunit n=1 Tax=Malassezia nana TaxID=180528 RepID=A0AAF0EL31_9BASI|nr:secretory subunit [Malassezia nana]
MSGYKYDEEGGQFMTFCLTALLAFMIPYTYRTLRRKCRAHAEPTTSWLSKPGHKVPAVQLLLRTSRTGSVLHWAVLVVGWAAVAWLFKKVIYLVGQSQHQVYDPFSILGIATSATEREIRRRYRKLSVEFHPDKVGDVSNQTKAEIESHYIEITKAYKALTDETIRRNYEEYGHPDGKQEMSMGIALPTWIVDSQNNWLVLAVYGLVFGVGLPLLVARWWYGTRSRTKDGVLNATALSFFLALKPTVTAQDVPLLLAKTEELQTQFVGQLRASDEAAMEELTQRVCAAYKSDTGRALVPEDVTQPVARALVLLMAYLYRVDSSSAHVEQIKLQIGHYTEKLLTSLLAMSASHNRLEQTNAIRDMMACVVQAVPLSSSGVAELLQLPHMTLPLAQAAVRLDPVAKHGLQGLWKVPDAERRAVLAGPDGMSADAYAECIRALSEWPRLELVDAYFTVVGEERVSAGSLMHLVLKMRLLPPKRDGSLLREGRRLDAKNKDGSDSVRSGMASDSLPDEAAAGCEPTGYVYAPYFAEERKPQWFVQMGDHKNNYLILPPTKFGDIGPTQTRTVHLPVIAPPEPGVYTFRVEVTSDSYLGSNAQKLMKLNVAEQRLASPEEEDEISDPEEDTIAGQMALMRGEKVKPSNVEYADDDEAEEDEDEEEADEQTHDSDSDSDSDSD